MRKIIFLLLRIVISLGVLIFLIKQIDLSRLIQVVSNAQIPILILALLLFLLIYFISFFRWKMLIIGLGLNPPLGLIIRSCCLGFFCNIFSPSTTGGDVMRSIDLGIRTQQPRQVVASVILDRLSGYSAMLTIAALALLLGWRIVDDVSVFISLGILLTFLGAVIAVLFNNFLFTKSAKLFRFFGRIGEALVNLHYEIYNFRSQKVILEKNFVLSLIMQLILPLAAYLISLALGAKINLLYFYILVPIISSISALPISIAGLGLREASSMYFFTRVGMPAEIALAVAFLTFLIMFLFGLVGGIVYLLTFSKRTSQ